MKDVTRGDAGQQQAAKAHQQQRGDDFANPSDGIAQQADRSTRET